MVRAVATSALTDCPVAQEWSVGYLEYRLACQGMASSVCTCAATAGNVCHALSAALTINKAFSQGAAKHLLLK